MRKLKNSISGFFYVYDVCFRNERYRIYMTPIYSNINIVYKNKNRVRAINIHQLYEIRYKIAIKK